MEEAIRQVGLESLMAFVFICVLLQKENENYVGKRKHNAGFCR